MEGGSPNSARYPMMKLGTHGIHVHFHHLQTLKKLDGVLSCASVISWGNIIHNIIVLRAKIYHSLERRTMYDMSIEPHLYIHYEEDI